MKKIISGKMYNTETAREVGKHYGPGNWSDFCYYEETLYCKKTGEYFLFGEGNANSKYAEWCGVNERGSGRRIEPFTYSQACEWAEKNMESDDYISEFGPVGE